MKHMELLRHMRYELVCLKSYMLVFPLVNRYLFELAVLK